MDEFEQAAARLGSIINIARQEVKTAIDGHREMIDAQYTILRNLDEIDMALDNIMKYRKEE